MIEDPVFQVAFRDTLRKEGVYSDHPNDAGGKTKYGVTEKVARRFGYQGDMIDLSLDFAQKIYYEQYYLKLGLHNMTYRANHSTRTTVHDRMARKLFDMAVNIGVTRTAKIFQRCINLLNRAEKDSKNLIVDGVIGRGTLSAYFQFDELTLEQYIPRLLVAYQMRHYIWCCEESNENNEHFIRGWIRRAGYEAYK